MSIEVEELANEMINHLNEIGRYSEFLLWMKERGWDIDEVEEKMNEIVEEG